jgi:cytochrome c oxidase assembly factor CtaG
MDAFLSAWRCPVLLLAASAAALIYYFVFVRPLSPGRIASFTAGLALLIFLAASPLDRLAREYLLSAGALIHVAAALVTPLFLVVAFPPADGTPAKGPALPVLCWLAGSISFSVWYLPALLDSALRTPWLWDLMLLTLAGGGVALWWPLFGPVRARRIKPVPAGIWYLFAAMIWCSFVGMILAFTGLDRYQPYVRSTDTLNILSFIRNDLELTRSADQETGGMLVWLCTMLVFLNTIMVLFYKWYKSPEVRNEFAAPSGEIKKAREDQA